MKDNKLSQLDQMLKDGTINQEEYENKMKEILKKENKTTNNDSQENKKNRHNKKTIIVVVVCIILAVIIVFGIVGKLLKNDVTDKLGSMITDMEQEREEKTENGEFFSYQVYSNFTEDDLAWVRAKYEEEKYITTDYFVCVNKNGDTILQYKEYDDESAPDGIKSVTSFHNGIAIVTDGDDNKRVINKEGKTLIEEGDEDCTEILSTNTTLGYVIIKKVDDTYMGTTNSYGVIDNQGKFIVPLSPENENPLGKDSLKTIAYGIFRDGSNIINIKDGAIAESTYWYGEKFWDAGDKIIQYTGDTTKEMVVYTAKDLKECARKKFRGVREIGNLGEEEIYVEYRVEDDEIKRGFFNEELKEVLDLSELEITNKPVFKDGYAGLIIRKNWYTVIDENGEMQFEPVKIENGDPVCLNLGNKNFYIEENGKGKIIDEKNNIKAQLKTRIVQNDGVYYYSDGYIESNGSGNGSGEFIDVNGETMKIYFKNK